MVLDTGASKNVLNDINLLNEVETVPEITVGPAHSSMVKLTHVEFVTGNMGYNRLLRCNAYHILNLNLHLLSCSRLDDRSITTIIASEKCTLLVRNKND